MMNNSKKMAGKSKMPAKNSFISSDKEVKFGKPDRYMAGGKAQDEIDKRTSFGEARKAARAAGNTTFTWRGKSYGSRGSDETPEQFNKKMKTAADRDRASNESFARDAKNRESNDYWAGKAKAKAQADKVAKSPKAIQSRTVSSVANNRPTASLQTSRTTVPVSKSKKETRQDNRTAKKTNNKSAKASSQSNDKANQALANLSRTRAMMYGGKKR
jgi:hypothetical protein